jgi:hypothetical protein
VFERLRKWSLGNFGIVRKVSSDTFEPKSSSSPLKKAS